MTHPVSSRRDTLTIGTQTSADQDRAGRNWWWWPLAACALIALALLSLSLGHYTLGPLQLAREALATVFPALSGPVASADQTVFFQIRVPRVMGAVVVGAALAGSGSAYQSLFRNPLVSPDILGVSAGAGLGASVGILLGLPFPVVQLLAFGLGLLGAGLSVGIAGLVGQGSTVVLVLAGRVVSAMAGALISLTQYFANPATTLPAITFWLQGGLGRVSPNNLWVPVVLVTVCVGVLYGMRWPITVLSAGEDEARALGVDRRLVWGVVVVAATLMTATVVSLAGIVAWVGLVVPHLARYIVGPSFTRLLWASLLVGAAFLLAVDDVARSASIELPLGVLTALIGAPFFVGLLARARNQWL